jgi:general secretion pathway protein D
MDVSVDRMNQFGLAYHGGTTADLGGGSDTIFIGGFRPINSVVPTASDLQGLALGARGPELENTTNAFPALAGVSIPAFGVVLNALATSGDANILATPHIIATDNVPAEIQVGENIPLQTNVGGGLSNLAGLAGAGGQGGNPAAGLAALSGLSSGFSAPREDVGNKIKVTPHINESDQVRLEIEQESSSPGAPTGALGVIPITRRTANTTVVVKDQQTVVIGGLMRDEFVTSKDKVPILGDIPILGVLFSKTSTTKRKSNLLLILTPHVIREQADLRRIFERKMQERQEFIDRYFVFATDRWEPPMDYTRSNGLVEDIRQAYFEQAERQRLEDELRPREIHDHSPSEPIDLPSGIKRDGGAAKPAPAPRPRPAPKKKGEAPVQPAPPPAPTAQMDSGAGSADGGPDLRIAPPLRSVPSAQPGE